MITGSAFIPFPIFPIYNKIDEKSSNIPGSFVDNRRKNSSSAERTGGFRCCAEKDGIGALVAPAGTFNAGQ